MRRLVRWMVGSRGGSRLVDESVVERYLADPDFPVLVSFPRTGSHWLRMIMERVFERPALARTFYLHDADSYTCIHMHDLEMEVRRRSVIYLYRHPVDTVYSHLRYHELDPTDPILVRFWATRYALHLRKWLHDENFTRAKTTVTYELLRADAPSALKAIGSHLSLSAAPSAVDHAVAAVDKAAVARKTAHDPRVVRRQDIYAVGREEFRRVHTDLVLSCVRTQGLDPDDL